MGHLINARGFRVGWTLVWCDFWYAPLYDYSSFFFFCARLRAMLQLMFYAKIIDRSEFIFSHFEIIKSFKVLHVNIYFYFIYFELYTAKLHSNLWFAFKYRKWRNVFKYKKSPVKKFFSYPLYDSNKRFVLLYRFLKSAKKMQTSRDKLWRKLPSSATRSNSKHSRHFQLFNNRLLNTLNWKSWMSADTFFLHSEHYSFIDPNLLRRSIKSWNFALKDYHVDNEVAAMIEDSWVRHHALVRFIAGQSTWLEFWPPRNNMYFSLENLNFFNTAIYQHITSYKVVNRLLHILNEREHKLSYIIDGIKPLFYFSFHHEHIIDVLLDNYLDSLDLTDGLREIFKVRISISMLIKALIYAFDCQWISYRLWFSRPSNWFSQLLWWQKKQLLHLYVASASRNTSLFFRKNYYQLIRFRRPSKLQNDFRSERGLKYKRIWRLYKSTLLKQFVKKYINLVKFKVHKNRMQRMLFCYAALSSGYLKSTLFDFAFFRILYKSFCAKNYKLIKKFFFLKAKFFGRPGLRSFMRQFFIFRLFWLNYVLAPRPPKAKQSFGRARNLNLKLDLQSEPEARRFLGFQNMNQFIVNYLKPIFWALRIELDTYLWSFFKSKYSWNFLLITNNEVSATFLARYIGKKLTYGHRLRSLLHPLRREFKHLAFRSSLSPTFFVDQRQRIQSVLNVKRVWYLLLLAFLLYYDRFNCSFFSSYGTLYSVNFFLSIAFITMHLGPSKSLLFLVQKLFKYRILFIQFFLQYTNKINVALTASFSQFWFKHLTVNWYLPLSVIYYDFFTSKSSLGGSITAIPYRNLLKFSLFQFTRFLQLSYNLATTNYLQTTSNLANQLSLNFLKVRINRPIDKIYKGFKIKCVGRFTRRQRALGYWFTLGKIPLNTVAAHIEYDSHMVILANSSITIKVWIFKSRDASKYYIEI